MKGKERSNRIEKRRNRRKRKEKKNKGLNQGREIMRERKHYLTTTHKKKAK